MTGRRYRRTASQVVPPSNESAAMRSTEGSELLRVNEVHCHFGGVRALNGASFVVSDSSITGLIGPNGAGKSTMLNVIAGLIRPNQGSIRFIGEDIAGQPSFKVARRGIIRTFQLSRLFPQLTVLENLLVAVPRQRGESLFGALASQWLYWGSSERVALERARSLLAEFGLADKESDYAGTLSGGQRRILEIARAVIAEPRLLLLDEPMAGVSPTHRDLIAQHLETLRDRGLTILMTEHELELVDRLCSKVVVMAQGKVISQGALHAVRGEERVKDAYLVG